jgi:adenylate cyclase
MGDDEVATVRTLIEYRELMTARILQYGGRVVDAPGDNLLAEFASAVHAVQCAVEIQQELATRNAALPPHRRMEFRIGINLGDVIVEDERLYGDSVNITARVEELAEAGGLCLSGTAYDQIDTKVALSCIYLGEHTVKNIAKPIRVYRVVGSGDTASFRGRPARQRRRHGRRCALLAVALWLHFLVGGAAAFWRFPWPLPAASSRLAVPAQASIMVLPFVNLSHDSQPAPIHDVMTTELITALAKYAGLLVMAPASDFTQPDNIGRAQQVGQALGIRYVVAGSVRTAAGQVRITVQLIDATTGYYLWAEGYERALGHPFVLQDEIIEQIVAALLKELSESERAHVQPPRDGRTRSLCALFAQLV